VLEWRHALRGRGLGQAGHLVLENPAIILIDRDLFARSVRRFEILAYPQLAAGIDAPGQVEPELVFFPHLTGVHITGVLIFHIEFVHGHPPYRLAEADPLTRMGFIGMNVMPLSPVT